MSFSEPYKKFDISTETDSGINFNTEKSLEGHVRSVTSILHFDSPHNKLVSCSYDGTIRIWSSETYECLWTTSAERVVNDLIKMKLDVYLSCSDDKYIRSYSIISHEELKRFQLYHSTYRLLKLTEDLFLCYRVRRLLILSFPQFEIVKSYKANQCLYSNPLLLSRNYPNCFYVGTNDKHDPILLIDFENDKIVKEFVYDEAFVHETIVAMSLFYNSKNEEILIACQNSESIYTFNTSHPKFDTNKEINNNQMEVSFSRYSSISCCCWLSNQYLFCGDEEGSVHIYEFAEQESEIRRIGKKKIFEGNFASLGIKTMSSKGNQSARMITGDANGEIRITRVNGLRLKENRSYEQTDLKERIHFLFHEPEKFFFDEKKKTMEIMMENKWIYNILKIFLRL